MELLPLYQCHKQVRAAKIISITREDSGAAEAAVLFLDANEGQTVMVDAAWLQRNPKLAEGGYFVEYQQADNYTAYSPADPFETGYSPVQMSTGQMSILGIARVCHEANRALCASLADYSQLPWEAAPDWQRKSAVVGVGFNLTNPDAPASASHDSWLAEKERDGWKYGPLKDAEKKEHPCYVPYEQLPKEQQAKDHLFKAIVAALAPLLPKIDPCDGCNCAPVDCPGGGSVESCAG